LAAADELKKELEVAEAKLEAERIEEE